jgi:radical SAM superfamily enzyme YgiQ (UPF0313 family)
MRVQIVIPYVPRYRRGHRFDFVPPVTALHLAALTPPEHEVTVVHEQVRPVPLEDRPDVVALSFFSGFARHAYQLADQYRRMGVRVIAGGPHVSYWIEEALEHVDVVVVGEAEEAWPALLADLARGRAERVYRGRPSSMSGLPTPRYDLLEDRFVVPRVMQATRGCHFRCHFCTVPDFNPGFRARPVPEVIRDVAETHFSRWWQEKVVWFWDDNLLVDRRWAKTLLRAMCGLGRWWLTQASIDVVQDRELLDLMERSGCIGIFLGIESLQEGELRSVGKRHNRTARYREAIERLHERGICVMAGFIAGLDGQTPEAIRATADGLNDLGVDVPFLGVLTPYRGTPLYADLLGAGRILTDRDWPHYNGYNVAFQPARMSPEELLLAHRGLWQRAFGPAMTAHRLWRGARTLSRGGFLLSAAMNGFYGLKGITGNLPADAPRPAQGEIVHAPAAPARASAAR